MNALPQIVRKEGPHVEMPREEKAYAYRVEAKTLRRVEQRNRTQDVELQNQYRLVELEQAVLQAAFKKQRVTVKKRALSYNKTVSELSALKVDFAYPPSKTFLTELSTSVAVARSGGGRAHAAAAASVSAAAAAAASLAAVQAATVSAAAPTGDRAAAAAAARIAFDLDALGSVRRKTRPIHGAAAVCRSLADLRRLQRKNMREFDESMDALHRLEIETGMTVSARIPARSYTPPASADAPLKPSAYLAHLRRKVSNMERELQLLEMRRLGGGARSAGAAAPGVRESCRPSSDDGGGEGDDCKNGGDERGAGLQAAPAGAGEESATAAGRVRCPVRRTVTFDVVDDEANGELATAIRREDQASAPSAAIKTDAMPPPPMTNVY